MLFVCGNDGLAFWVKQRIGRSISFLLICIFLASSLCVAQNKPSTDTRSPGDQINKGDSDHVPSNASTTSSSTKATSAPVSQTDQMLKTEEHTVKALENVYAVATGILTTFVVLLGAGASIFGYKSVKDFRDQLDKAKQGFEDISVEARKMTNDLKMELDGAIQQRLAWQEEKAKQLNDLQEKIDGFDSFKIFIEDSLLKTAELVQHIDEIGRRMAEVRDVSEQSRKVVAGRAREKIIIAIERASELAEKLHNRQMWSLALAHQGRLFLWLEDWGTAERSMLHSYELDQKVLPDRSYNLACLYGQRFQHADTGGGQAFDIDSIRWANETVERVISKGSLTTQRRGHWANLIQTDPDLAAVRSKHPAAFEAMQRKLAFE
jgi:hypothetical protein